MRRSQPLQAREPKKTEKPKKAKSHTHAVTIFMLGGSFFILMLSVVPIWNAVSLLQNFNYTFWAGIQTPRYMLVIIASIVFFYVGVCLIFFRRSNSASSTGDGVMHLATILITILGLFLLIVSLPLQSQASYFEDKILYHCRDAAEVHRVMEYSKVLQNIRASPVCKHKFSVVDCPGYQESYPYTDYLKDLESKFHCAGFCAEKVVVKKSAIMKVVKNITVVKNKFYHHHFHHSLGALRRQFRLAQKSLHKAVALGQESAMNEAEQAEMTAADAILTEAEAAAKLAPAAGSEATEASKVAEKDVLDMTTALKMPNEYPPTLFSDANYLKSCEGMAARDMENTAGDIGRQTFFQGLLLVSVAVLTGFLKLLGFCVHKKEPHEEFSDTL